MSKNVKEIVVEKILKMIKEDNLMPWQKPWFFQGQAKRNITRTDKPYSFLNQMLLSDSPDNYFLTFKQCESIGASIKKGAQSQIVTFWKINEYPKKKDGAVVTKDGKIVMSTIPVLRYYRVFGISDIENLPEKYQKIIEDSKIKGKPKKSNTKADAYIKKTKAKIKNINNEKAYFSPVLDLINIPEQKYFKSNDGYYSTIFHELVHWTGHESRLGRIDTAHFDDRETYSKEELVAEIGATIIKKKFGYNKIENNVAYINGWMNAIKNDVNLIIAASSRSEKAIDFLDSLQSKTKGGK